MYFKKFLAYLIGFIFIFVFFIANLSFVLFDTYFDSSFYESKFTDFLYVSSKEMFINSFENENSEISQYISKEDVLKIVDEYYKKDDLKFIIKDFIANLINYNSSKDIIISLNTIKLDFKNISDEILNLYKEKISFEGEIKSIDFYEYVPAEFNFSANFDPNILLSLSVFFQYKLLAEFLIFVFLALLIFSFYLLISENNHDRFRKSGFFLLISSIINLGWLYVIFRALEIFFIKDFPIKTINSVNTDIGNKIYIFLINPLFAKMLNVILFILILSVILILTAIFSKKKLKTKD